jgi:hypothetical protein
LVLLLKIGLAKITYAGISVPSPLKVALLATLELDFIQTLRGRKILSEPCLYSAADIGYIWFQN